MTAGRRLGIGSWWASDALTGPTLVDPGEVWRGPADETVEAAGGFLIRRRVPSETEEWFTRTRAGTFPESDNPPRFVVTVPKPSPVAEYAVSFSDPPRNLSWAQRRIGKR